MHAPWITLIGGATASGKSAYALRLAEESGGEIVNADSMQVYADLRVLTARPNPDEQRRATHHLYGVADAGDAWSVGRWLRETLPLIESIGRRGRPVLVVGGTGLYFHALTRGLAPVPVAPEAIREAAGAAFDRLGEPAFREALARRDPEAATRIAPGDRQRLVRAWAVVESTGRALSDWRAETRSPLPRGAWRSVVIEPPRAAIYARCDARAAAMVEAGALEEVRGLVARGLSADTPLMKAVGVRPLAACLVGDLTLDQGLEAIRQETRRYAKRQLTWFRNQAPDWPRLDPFTGDSSVMPH